jgi:membrane protein DedA with SNARE-associated domain
MEAELLHYGYLFVLVGVIVEGDATLLSASFLARHGYFSLLYVVGIAAIATSSVTQAYFELARRRGPGIVKSYPAASRRVERVFLWLTKYGALLVVASRFLVGFRTLVPVVCGASGMKRWRFAMWNVTGAVCWAGAVASAGYAGAHGLAVVLADIRRHELIMAGGLAMMALGVTAWFGRGREWRDFWHFRQPSGRKQGGV